MHTNTILAAFFAGSQIAAANLVPRSPQFGGGDMMGHSRWRWGPHGMEEWQHGRGGHRNSRQGNKDGFIGLHPTHPSGPSDGFIGKHRGHDGPPGSRPTGGSSAITVTVTVTDSVTSTPTGQGPGRTQPPGTTPSFSTITPSPTTQPSRSKGNNNHQPSGGGGGGGVGGSSTGGTFQSQVLHFHNVHRSNHSASPLTWSADLATIANTIAQSCVFEHKLTPGGGGYGQNIAAGSPPSDISKVVSNEFYNGEVNDFTNLYGQANPSMTDFEQWGHFSQLVWKGTKQVGCATVQCPGGVGKTQGNVQPFFTVCNYKPPGNVAGEYAQNVGKPLGRPSVVA